ncbi:MAG: DegT/DnrJ/EryC1/StrS family aminotransferase [Candidatus Paceibacterota bacterium]|jgi:dTDP-4-amino-4,6-dideoxygalactose transaminase
MKYKLAYHTNNPSILKPLPHEVWPPNADEEELRELACQRNKDIGIKGCTGPIKELEDNFKDFLDNKVKYALTFNSGTSALLASYFAIGLDEGDELIGPALTYHAALSPAFLLKANIILCDVDRNTRCIDPDKIESLLTEKTKAITVVHQWGHPADMDKILKIVKGHNLKLIEDCSHAHGSRYKGRLCGTFGDVAVFSLQTNKAIFAGEGGILVTNNENIYNRATLLGHYRDRCREEIKDPLLNKYWATGFGLKLRMSPFNAIVAKHSLVKFKQIKEGRHKCLNYFIDRLKEIDYIEPTVIEDYIDMGAWYGFKPLYLKDKLYNIDRDRLILALQKEGMDVSAPSGKILAEEPLYNSDRNVLFTNIYRKTKSSLEELPVARLVNDSALSLPTFYNWEDDKKLIDEYMQVFKKIKDNYKELL